MEDFNKLMIVAPNIDSNIKVDMYAYQAANAIYGCLNIKKPRPGQPEQPEKPRERQIHIISGYVGSLATAESLLHAKESIEVIASILENEFKVPSDVILRCDDADLSACVIRGKKGSPKFHTGFRGTGRRMGVVGDEEGIVEAIKGLEDQNIASEVFKVINPPIFGQRQFEETQATIPTDIRPYMPHEEARLAAGDE